MPDSTCDLFFQFVLREANAFHRFFEYRDPIRKDWSDIKALGLVIAFIEPEKQNISLPLKPRFFELHACWKIFNKKDQIVDPLPEFFRHIFNGFRHPFFKLFFGDLHG